MTDIVERLRRCESVRDMAEGADEIERLRVELAIAVARCNGLSDDIEALEKALLKAVERVQDQKTALDLSGWDWEGDIG